MIDRLPTELLNLVLTSMKSPKDLTRIELVSKNVASKIDTTSPDGPWGRLYQQDLGKIYKVELPRPEGYLLSYKDQYRIILPLKIRMEKECEKSLVQQSLMNQYYTMAFASTLGAGGCLCGAHVLPNRS